MRNDIPSGSDIKVQYRMALEIILNRHDETPWGFRMTGGKEFESPFFVVKVARGGIAERSGLFVGDMVYAINHEYANQYSHADAQRIILHTGKTLILNIRRGELRPGNSTPMPDFSDAIMRLEAPPTPSPPPIPTPPPPYEPPKKIPGVGDMDFLQNLEPVEGTIRPKTVTPPPEPLSPETPEGELEQDAFFSIKIKRSGRISAIEELEGPSRSPSTSRSRSQSRERKKSITKSSGNGSVQKSQESEEECRNMSERTETVTTESTEMMSMEKCSMTTEIQESVKIGSSRMISVGNGQEQTDTQVKTTKTIGDLTDDDITDMLTGEAQVLDEDKGTIGINFNKLIPKVNFIKDSSVLKALEEQQFKKEETEEEQLAKEPTKRFSTFLQRPARPAPQQKCMPDVNEELPWKKRMVPPTPKRVQQTAEKEAVKTESSSRQESLQSDSRKQIIFQDSSKADSRRQSIQDELRKQSIQSETDALSIQLEEIIEKEVIVEEESTVVQHSSIEQTEVVEEEVEGLGVVIGHMEITDDMVEVVEEDDDEKKSVRFEDESQKESRSESISSMVQSSSVQSSSVQSSSLMLEGYSRKDVKMFKKEEMYEESKKVVSGGRLSIESSEDFEQQLTEIHRRLSELQSIPESMQSHVASVQEQLTKIVEMTAASDTSSEKVEQIAQVESSQVVEEVNESESKDDTTENNSDTANRPVGSPVQEVEDIKVEDTKAEDTKVEEDQPEIQITLKAERPQEQQQSQEPEGPEYCVAPPSNNFPHTPQPRPIVLPGGRKWRKPKDAFNDQFIAEAIIGQSEVLVGSTIGINFCKYIPAKFDGANSAVCRLIHELEDKTKKNKEERGIEGRAEKVLAKEDYHPPISKRHFFAAKLAERTGSDQP